MDYLLLFFFEVMEYAACIGTVPTKPKITNYSSIFIFTQEPVLRRTCPKEILSFPYKLILYKSLLYIIINFHIPNSQNLNMYNGLLPTVYKYTGIFA